MAILIGTCSASPKRGRGSWRRWRLPPTYGEFFNSFLGGKCFDAAVVSTSSEYCSPVMVLGIAGDLRQMSNTNDLMARGEALELQTDQFGSAPPMPASTSSNTRVSAWPLRLRSPFKASRMRESSPPDATLASGFKSSPGLAESRNSI